MQANIQFDREAVIELLKKLDVDIKPEIVNNYKELVQREVQRFCESKLKESLDNYAKDYWNKRILDEVVKNIKIKLNDKQYDVIDKEVDRILTDYVKSVNEAFSDRLAKINEETKEMNFEEVIQTFVDNRVKKYLDTKFK